MTAIDFNDTSKKDPLYGFKDNKGGDVLRALHYLEVAGMQEGKRVTEMPTFKVAAVLRDSSANPWPHLIAATLAEPLLGHVMHGHAALVNDTFSSPRVGEFLDRAHERTHVIQEQPHNLPAFLKASDDDFKKNVIATGTAMIEDMLEQYKGKSLDSMIRQIQSAPGMTVFGFTNVREIFQEVVDYVDQNVMPVSGTLKTPDPSLEDRFAKARFNMESRLNPGIRRALNAAAAPEVKAEEPKSIPPAPARRKKGGPANG